MMYILKKI